VAQSNKNLGPEGLPRPLDPSPGGPGRVIVTIRLHVRVLLRRSECSDGWITNDEHMQKQSLACVCMSIV
jgi:hypothetical protein